MMDKGSCTDVGGGVRHWYGFRPLGEEIDDCKEIPHVLGLIKGTN